jgi:hypothetical protein
MKKVDLAEGEWIEVRMPSLSILDKAKAAVTRRAIETMAGIDSAAFANMRGLADQEVERSAADEYDWQTLLAACIVSWSYEDPLTPENVAELGPDTVAVLLAELLPRESAEERKKGSAVSTKRLTVRA